MKPSVVKPAAKVKPGQKRKAAERSAVAAVAAVRPLSNPSAVLAQPRQEAASTDRQVPVQAAVNMNLYMFSVRDVLRS